MQQRASELQKKAKLLTDQVDGGFKGKYLARPTIFVNRDDLQNSIRINEAALKASHFQENIDTKISSTAPHFQPSVETNTKCQNKVVPTTNSVNSSKNVQQSPGSEDSETEKKYLELIDLLTVKMFENDPNIPIQQQPTKSVQRPKKSNSLPRTMEIKPLNSLHKSSSQNFQFESQCAPPGSSAYERLFGCPRPGL